MNYWFYLNLITFIFAVVTFLLGLPKTSMNIFATLLGIIGLFCILFNWNMHAIFSKIRELKSRSERIKIAGYARKIMPYHIFIGVCGLILISGHLLLFLWLYGLFINLKALSGFLAYFGLIVVTISGYLRQTKASRITRLFHLYSSFILFLLIVLHLLT